MGQIRIFGDIESSSIYFIGSTVSPKGMGTVEAFKKDDEDRIVVVRNDKFERGGDDATLRRIFKRLNPNRVQNKDGEDLIDTLGYDIDQVIEYINGQANLDSGVAGGDGTGTDMTGIAMDFVLDATSTSIMADTGHEFGVNTIKAQANDNGLIDIRYMRGELILFCNIDYLQVTIDGSSVGGGINDVVDALNELFTVGAFESVVIRDPFSTLVANIGGELAGYTEEGVNFVDPAGSDLGTNSVSNNSQAGIKSVATINKVGEYFTFDIRGKSTYGFGLVHSQASYDLGHYIGNATYADPTGFCVTNNQHYGFQFSHWFHIGNAHASWTNYGANTSYVMGGAWSDHNNQFDEKEDWNNNDPVTMKVGVTADSFIEISSKKDDGTFVLHARSNYPVPEGFEFHLGVKFYYNTARLLSAPKVHLIEVDDSPTVIGDTNITLLGDATGTLAAGIVTPSGSNTDNGFITNEGLSTSGEYFEFEVNLVEDHTVCLVDADIYDTATIAADASTDLITPYAYFGQPINTLGAVALSHINNSGLAVTVQNRPVSVKYRIGFDNSGKFTVWSSENGTDFIVSKHLSSASADGDYRLMWIGRSSSATFESLAKGELEEAPTMYFRYAESPDGVFKHPIFGSADEAEYYDRITAGTETGSIQAIVFPDDPTGAIWYRPDNGYTSNGAFAPVAETFLGNPVLYSEITTLTNADLAPPAFTDTTIIVNEGDTVNYQVSPQDVGYVTTIGSAPPWQLTDGFTVSGTAPEVAGDNVANPYDETTVTVYRTNSYGTSQGTLTIRIQNLTAPVVVPITGFTHVAESTPLITPDVMADGSVIVVDETIEDKRRFIITKEWVQDNVLPALSTSTSVVLGLAKGSADFANGADVLDFDAYIQWFTQEDNTIHGSILVGDTANGIVVQSMTNAYYDYAFELDGTDLHVIACNVNDINTQIGINYGGTFGRVVTKTGVSGAPLTLHLGIIGNFMGFSEVGLSEIVIPAADNWIQVTESGNILSFDGSTTFPTLQAGYTYRLLMGEQIWADQVTDTHIQVGEIIKFTADGITEYDMGGTWTQVGTEGTGNAYIEFTVPTDVPPLHWYGSASHNPINLDGSNAIAISGSAYVEIITGITLEGLASNQTGTNIADNGGYGWMSVDESLSAGERFVMNNAFFEDLLAEMGDQYEIRIGLKGTNWSNAATSTETNSVISGDIFRGDIQLRIYRSSSNNIYLQLFRVGETGNQMLVNTVSLHNDTCGFIEVNNTGDTIRMAFGRNGDIGVTVGSESTTTYEDWSSYKMEAYDPNLNITSLDVMFLVTDIFNGNNDNYNGANVDWTHLSEIPVPTSAVTNQTSWTKALDFSGSSERAIQVNQNTTYNALRMNGLSATVGGNANANYTTSLGTGRPWATAIVFSADLNGSNQHIWNSGEGANSTDDNIYLRLSSDGRLYFGWGRTGALNELYLGTLNPNIDWYGCYIASTGERLSGANATPTNLAKCFDVRLMHSGNNFTMSTYNWSNDGVGTGWNSSFSTTGGRMDRSILGDFCVGGRNSNRSFHGKVASMVITTLKLNVPMPTDAEIHLMITDPKKWEDDYLVGNTIRQSHYTTNATYSPSNIYAGYGAIQIWLMGDGTNDSYSNMIRNEVFPSDQNYTKLDMLSMVSNDIQTVTINGLTQ